jgi:hypothetical protein
VARKLIAELILDPSQYIRGLRKAERASKEFTASQQKVFGAAARGAGARLGVFGGLAGGFAGGSAAFAAGTGAALTVQGLEKSVQAASDLNEQMSKTTVVFGQSAQQVKDWAKTTTEGFGIAQREALATASSFGALFQPMGLVGAKAAEQSEKLTELGADLASFYNTDVADALDAIRSGIVGESEPLRRYGVLLTETRVQHEALRETGLKHVQQLTAQDKALARIQLIFQDTSKAQGDYFRTSEGLANQTRTLKSNIDDLSTSIGELLVPAVTDATGKLNELFAAAKGPPGGGGGKKEQTDLSRGFDRLGSAAQKAGKLVSFWFMHSTYVIPVKAAAGAVKLLGSAFSDSTQVLDGYSPAAEAAAKATHGLALAAREAATAGAAAKYVPTVQQRNTWFDQMISRGEFRAGLLTDLDKQIAEYKTIVAKLKARLAVTNDATRQARLEDQILQDNATIASLQAQKAANLKAAIDLANANRKAAIEAAKQEHEDWLAFAYEKAQTTKTVKDDLRTAQANLDYWKLQARTGKYTVDEARQVLHWQEELKRIRKQGQDTDPLAGLMQVSSARLAAILAVGTGLSAAGRRILGMNIAGAEIQPMHVHVNIDGREVGRAVTKDQARTSKRTAQQTSGRRG